MLSCSHVSIVLPLLLTPHYYNNLARSMICRYWLSVGAQPSDTVARLLGVAGVLPRLSRNTGAHAPKEVPPPTHTGEPDKV